MLNGLLKIIILFKQSSFFKVFILFKQLTVCSNSLQFVQIVYSLFTQFTVRSNSLPCVQKSSIIKSNILTACIWLNKSFASIGITVSQDFCYVNLLPRVNAALQLLQRAMPSSLLLHYLTAHFHTC